MYNELLINKKVDGDMNKPNSTSKGKSTKKAGSKPSHKSAKTTESKSGSKFKESSARKSGSKFGSSSAQKSSSKFGSSSARKSGNKFGNSAVRKSDSKYEGDTAYKSEGKIEQGSAHKSGNQFGSGSTRKPSGKFGNSSTRRPGGKFGSSSEQRTEKKYGNDTERKSGNKFDSGSERKSGNKFENRSERRSGNKFENRSERRSDSKFQSSSENKFKGKSEHKKSNRYGNKPDRRSDEDKSKGKSYGKFNGKTRDKSRVKPFENDDAPHAIVEERSVFKNSKKMGRYQEKSAYNKGTKIGAKADVNARHKGFSKDKASSKYENNDKNEYGEKQGTEKKWQKSTGSSDRYRDGGNPRSMQRQDRRENAPDKRHSTKPPTFVGHVRVTPAYEEFLTAPPCPVFDQCGGCQLQMYSNEGQLKYKFSKVIDLLGQFSKLEPIEGMDNPWNYRNKTHATFSFSKGKTKEIIAGIYEEESHHVVPTVDCLIQDKRANRIIETIVSLMPSFKMKPYDEDRGYGFLRHVLIRTAHAHEGVMLVLVGTSPIFPAKKKIVKAILEKHPEIETVVFNINASNTSMVLGRREETLYGKGFIEDTLCGMSFRISPKSFYQVNTIQTEKLYEKAIELAGLTGKEEVLDAYSGIGTIGMIASKKAKAVRGVELNKDAVVDAIKSARHHKIENIYFHQADATEFLVNLAEENEKIDVVFMDPPRSGSTPEFISAIGRLKPKKVIYISCSPETLARDLKSFVKQGYKVETIKPYDMFPWTGHVETVVQMVRKK